jgi:hypothetical protein
MEQLAIDILVSHLVRKGIETIYIPAFIRNVGYTMAADRVISLDELNNQLHRLGWSDVEVDDCTLQMILAEFQPDGYKHIEQRERR